MRFLKQISLIAFSVIFMALPSSAKTISLDNGKLVEVNLKNNTMNLLTFPFVIQSAQMSSETPEAFQVSSKNMSLIILATAENEEETADILVFSLSGEPFLLKVKATGDTQSFTFVSNKVLNESAPVAAKKFETGKVERDITNIMKKAVLGEAIPGYTRVNVNKQFTTPDLLMQKEFYYDGGKYRVETWLVRNTTEYMLTLDFANFYTDGILAMAFEYNTIKPGQVTKMWLIINKSSIAAKLGK
ncbi:type-F conjugative transfer system secretin TraK [Campylobacter sp. MOP7]|uniref:TraK domain-containing protein n=1 Tax=Campylobacter canis TaxID=3378588 RepID=UPI00387E49E7